MFSNDQHPGSFDDERRRQFARVLPPRPPAVYRPLHWPGQPAVTAPADDDVTSGSRDDLAPPPPTKSTRDFVDHSEATTTAAGEQMSPSSRCLDNGNDFLACRK